MKKTFYRSLSILLIFTFLFMPLINAQELELTAKSALLVVAETGQILYSKEAEQRQAPASITKVMTMYLTMEALDEERISLDDIVTVSTRAWEIGESSMFLNQGDRVSVHQLLQGMSIVSGNDAAISLAEHIAGSVEEFVKMMNAKAQELGLTNSHFANPHGLDADKHYMSAADMALLCTNLYNNYPEVIEYYSQKEFTYAGISQESRNPLLGRVKGVDGIKTGFTDDAGYSVVISGVKNDIRVIAVLLGTESEEIRSTESSEFFDYAYTHFDLDQIVDKNEELGEIPVLQGKENAIAYRAQEDFSLLIKSDESDQIEIYNILLEEIKAPIEAGQVLGSMEVGYNGQKLKVIPLIASKDVPKANIFKIIWQFILGFFQKAIRTIK
ncbi:MAG: D-alanyl-D-alanine carboxypeptidase [Firmicutes bacterium]|jgi:D-alanyl-D-alanine carboxypeptidase (penicillin-binding protein 5/6)|nr:D-alanyl-D-alanine carboxypeptidase [Bacillota bacterium]